jgi:hypothetical protein
MPGYGWGRYDHEREDPSKERHHRHTPKTWQQAKDNYSRRWEAGRGAMKRWARDGVDKEKIFQADTNRKFRQYLRGGPNRSEGTK